MKKFNLNILQLNLHHEATKYKNRVCYSICSEKHTHENCSRTTLKCPTYLHHNKVNEISHASFDRECPTWKNTTEEEALEKFLYS